MRTSKAGLDFIKSFEGYHRKLPNGDCKAYYDPVGIPTIGWGSIHGVRMGMVWTEEKAQSELEKEVSGFEDAVSRLVTVEINQNEFDALVSFAYNVGSAGLGRSSVLRHLNRNRRGRAANSFKLWNKGTIRGRKVVLRGLTRRRHAEAAMFLAPVPDMELEEDLMVQKVDASDTPGQITAKTATAVGVPAVGTAAGAIATPTVDPGPSIPLPPTETSDAIGAWQGFSGQIQSAATMTIENWPYVFAAIGIYALIAYGLPYFYGQGKA